MIKLIKLIKKIPNFSNLATKSSVTILVRDLDDRIDNLKKIIMPKKLV